MCGIYGFIGKKANKKTLKDISTKSGERGCDSNGIYYKNEIYKNLGNEIPMLDKYESGMVLGHHRLHTIQGTSKNIDFTHPVNYKGVIVVHNGVINDMPMFCDKFSLKNTNFDTMAIAEYIYNAKESPNVNNILESCAVVYIKDKQIVFCVKDYPFYIAEKKEGIYFCSKEFRNSVKFDGIKTMLNYI